MQLGEVFDQADPRPKQDDQRMQLISAQGEAAKAQEEVATVRQEVARLEQTITQLRAVRTQLLGVNGRLNKNQTAVMAIINGSKTDAEKVAEIRVLLTP